MLGKPNLESLTRALVYRTFFGGIIGGIKKRGMGRNIKGGRRGTFFSVLMGVLRGVLMGVFETATTATFTNSYLC